MKKGITGGILPQAHPACNPVLKSDISVAGMGGRLRFCTNALRCKAYQIQSILPQCPYISGGNMPGTRLALPFVKTKNPIDSNELTDVRR